MQCSSISAACAKVGEWAKQHRDESCLIAVGTIFLLGGIICHFAGLNALSERVLLSGGAVAIGLAALILCLKKCDKKTPEIDSDLGLEIGEPAKILNKEDIENLVN